MDIRFIYPPRTYESVKLDLGHEEFETLRYILTKADRSNTVSFTEKERMLIAKILEAQPKG